MSPMPAALYVVFTVALSRRWTEAFLNKSVRVVLARGLR